MKKLTAEKCKSVIEGFKWMSENTGMSIRDEYDLQAYQIALPVLEQQESTTYTYRQIENDGWIEWKGGECPVESSARVDLKLRGGVITSDFPATAADWRHYEYTTNVDIIAYRVIENDGREE